MRVDCGYLVHDLEVSDMNILRRIARVNRREQWDDHIRNDDIRENLGVTSVKMRQGLAVCAGLGICEGCETIGYQSGFCLQRFRVLEAGADLWIRLARIWKLVGLDWTSRLFLWHRIGLHGGEWFIIKLL